METRLGAQERLDSLKTELERNKLGQFATPPALALEIARYAKGLLKSRRVRFLDPAIGTGAFYEAALATFKLATAAGVEIDPAFAQTADSLWPDLRVTAGDFTRQEPCERFNLILTNPPYVRHHHIERDDKLRLRDLVASRLRIQLSGLAGLYCYFLLLADAWLDTGGLGVWLIPSEFMDVNYGSAVKRYLTERVTLLRIHRFCPSDVQFADALVSSAIVAFRKAPPPGNHSVEFTFGGSLSSPERSRRIALADLRNQDKWTGEAIERGDGLTLGDLFTIKRGLATGANSFFILPRDEAARYGIPSECLRPILPSPRYLSETRVKADRDGYPKIEKVLALIDCKHSEREIKRRFPRFWSYLERGKADLIHSGYLASRREPWYSQERREPAPFLCTYMGRRRASGHAFRFIWNQSKAVAANVYLMLYPKPALQSAFDSNPAIYARIFDALNEIDSEAFISEGRVYGGGLHKMEPAELSRLPADRLASIAGIRPLRQTVAFV